MKVQVVAGQDALSSVESFYRLEIVSLLAALIGILAGLVAYGLYDLIGLFTNLMS